MGSLIAFIAGFVVVIGSIMSATDKPMAFIDIPSIIIVVGGTFVASFISYEAKNAVAGLKWRSALSENTRIPKIR